MATETMQVNMLSAEDLLKNWQGHRRLTRKTIEAFLKTSCSRFQWAACGLFQRWRLSSSRWPSRSWTAWPPANGWNSETAAEAGDQGGDFAGLGRSDSGARREVLEDSAAPLQRGGQGLWAVGDVGAGDDPVRDRQRDSPSRAGICVSARAGHRASAFLGARLRRVTRSGWRMMLLALNKMNGRGRSGADLGSAPLGFCVGYACAAIARTARSCRLVWCFSSSLNNSMIQSGWKNIRRG